jgi:hypothetical protein
MVHGTDVPAMVERAIELIGGLGKLQLTGTRTLLKPNVVRGRAPPITTDPRVVQALGTLVQAEKPASLIVGELSAVMALPTRPHLERTGMLQVAHAIGADVIAFDDEDWVEVHPPHVEHTTTVVALGLIKAFGRWDLVTTKGVWEQVQIRRAMALGLGARGPQEVELVADDLTGHSREFAVLVGNIRRHVGLS